MNNSFTIRVADKNIKITAIHNYTENLCRDYLVENEPDIELIITQQNIDFERIKSVNENKAENLPIINYHDDYLESLAVYRKIADSLIEYDTILFHGSAICADEMCYLFTAKSGTGKSTHTKLWRKMLGNRAVMINDDKPLIKIHDDKVRVYGTPWNGKHKLGSNISAPLKAICILERAEKNTIVPISFEDAYVMMFQQVHKPNDPDKMSKMLKLIDKLGNNVKLYRLGCNMNPEAAKVAFEGMV